MKALWLSLVVLAGASLLVGAGLGISGATLQGALRNPLADPGLLGIGGCAALGAVLAYCWVLRLRRRCRGGHAGGAGRRAGTGGRGARAVTLVLAGIGVSAIAAALLALALALAPNPFALAEITTWLMGSLADRSLSHVALAAPPIVLGVGLLLCLGRGLDALSLGEDTAASMGVPVGRTLRLAAQRWRGASVFVGLWRRWVPAWWCCMRPTWRGVMPHGWRCCLQGGLLRTGCRIRYCRRRPQRSAWSMVSIRSRDCCHPAIQQEERHGADRPRDHGGR